MDVFQPSLRLGCEPDGEYTLEAMTLAPDASYRAGRAREGVPPEVRITPETFPVLLEVKRRKGMAIQMLTPLRHRLRNLKLGAAHGKTTVLAFVVVDGKTVGSASIPVGKGDPLPDKDPAIIGTRDFHAWVNRMPPGPPSFHVVGTVTTPTPGYDVRLEVATPQGFNPAILLMNLTATPRTGMWPQVVTDHSVRHDVDGYDGSYTAVTVLVPGGEGITLDVEEAW